MRSVDLNLLIFLIICVGFSFLSQIQRQPLHSRDKKKSVTPQFGVEHQKKNKYGIQFWFLLGRNLNCTILFYICTVRTLAVFAVRVVCEWMYHLIKKYKTRFHSVGELDSSTFKEMRLGCLTVL